MNGEDVVACPLCESVQLGQLRHDKLTQGLAATSYRLLECLDCQLIFLHPLLDTDTTADFYTEDYYGEENVRFLGPVEALSRWFRRNRLKAEHYFSAPGRALDIGCGRGEFLQPLADRGWECHGVEINEIAAQRARVRFPDRIHLGDLASAGYPDEQFDLVSIYHVIEHVPNPREIIDEISRILRPGGILLYATPNAASWGMRWFRERAFGVGILHNCFYLQPAHNRQMLRGRFEFRKESYFSLEQDVFSYLQCFLNVLGPNDNFLYSCLHRDAPERRRWLRLIYTVLLGGLLFPVTTTLACVSPLFGAGYTATYVLEKRGATEPAPPPSAAVSAGCES